MKNLRILSKISIFFILICMFIELFQFKETEDSSLLPDSVFSFTENWTMASFDSTKLSGTGHEDYKKIYGLASDTHIKSQFHKTSLPYTGKDVAGDILIFKNTLPEECMGLLLKFSSTDAIVYTLIDGQLVYQYGTGGKPQETLGINEHVISIPDTFQNGEILTILVPSYTDAVISLSGTTIESYNNVMIGIVGNSIAEIGCCLLIIVMAIIMFVLTLIRRYTLQPVRGELFLGFAFLAAGIYCFTATNTLSLFYNINSTYEMQEYLVLVFTILLTLYFELNLYKIYPRRFCILLPVITASAIVQVLLQITGICSLENLSGISVLALAAVFITVIASMAQLYHRSKNFQALLPALAVFTLLSGGITDIIATSFFEYRGVAGQYSMAISSIIFAAIHTLQLSKEYRAAAEESARLLEEKVQITEQQNLQLAKAKKDADAARHEATAANEAKGKFLAHMSHEIRTPINAVLGMDEMILRESKENVIKEYAMDIYTAGQTLLSLVNDILDFSKIESGKMEIVPAEYDACSMVHNLTNMASQRARDKNIELITEVEPDIPSRLYGDDVRIRQVLSNILTNAVKYTPEGTIWLRASEKQKTDGTVLLGFEVEDTGIGIKEEDLPKLFAEFERIEEDRNRNIEGTGLGMSITIQLLSLMGSRLQVESTYGKGSKFYFELEQKIADHTPIGDFNARIRQISENYNYSTKFLAPDAKILVTDDNSVNRKVLKNLLKETRIQVTEASGGRECLELMQKNHYDLVFLDHMMPGMDGIETLHHIKELSNFPCEGTPVIVLTANAVSGSKEYYLSEGFDDFLSKPVVPDQLENIIKKMLPEELVQEPSHDIKETTPGQILKDIPEDFLEGLPQVDGLDWHYAWLHLPDMELLEYTVKEFYAQISSAANQLEQAYGHITEPGQLELYRIQVHAMKSLAATIGIMPLSGVAKILEYAARDGRTSVISSITPAFLEEWRSYEQKLKGVFGTGSADKKEVTDYSVIMALIEMINLSMQEMDITQADQCVGQLKEYIYPDAINQNIQKLAEAVTNLDSDKTSRLAGLLIKQIEIQNT